MSRRKRQTFHSLMMLALEANQVIGLRAMTLMKGGRIARREAELMISEKVDMAVKTGVSLMLGASGAGIIRRYRRRVAANAKRLGRSSITIKPARRKRH